MEQNSHVRPMSREETAAYRGVTVDESGAEPQTDDESRYGSSYGSTSRGSSVRYIRIGGGQQRSFLTSLLEGGGRVPHEPSLGGGPRNTARVLYLRRIASHRYGHCRHPRAWGDRQPHRARTHHVVAHAAIVRALNDGGIA